MSSLARPAAGVVVVVGLAFACTNTIEGLPLEDDFAGGGTAAGASGMNGGTTGSPSDGTTSVGGSATPSGGAGTSGAPGLGGIDGGPAGTGGTSTGATSTGATSTGGSGVAGSAQAGSGAGSFGGTPATGSTAGGGASFSAVTAIITRTCAAATCHGGRRNPNLSAANLYANLTRTAVEECGNDPLVTAGDIANSALLQVVNGECDGLIMPPSCNAPPCFNAADMKTVSDWIASGAPR